MHAARFLGLLYLLGATDVAAFAAEPRPNVLFIAADDLGNLLDPERPSFVRTPNLDRLAAMGVRFDRAYNQIPLCNPSRASVLTGLRPAETQVYDLDRHFREAVPAVITLPQLFKQSGWKVHRVGKIYHYDVPKGIGTDGLDDDASWQGVVNPKGRDVADESLITNPTPQKPVSAALSWLAAEGTDEEQTDGMIATEAIRLMEKHQAEPFFLGVGFFRPHTPYVAPKKYFDLYPLESIALPEAPAHDRDDIPVAAFAHNNALPNYGLDTTTCRQALQAYYACVTFVDAQVGRLLEALDRLKLTDRTLIVFWSDHGYHLGEHQGIWQKRTLFEESARAPLIIRWPGLAGNGQGCRRIVEFLDIYPTVCDFAALPVPAHVAGRSLQPLLKAPQQEWPNAAFTQILRPGNGSPVMGRSLRTERWRYTEWNEGQAGVELYDHLHDPHEFQNLADTPEGRLAIPSLRPLFERKAPGAVPAVPFVPARL